MEEVWLIMHWTLSKLTESRPNNHTHIPEKMKPAKERKEISRSRVTSRTLKLDVKA